MEKRVSRDTAMKIARVINPCIPDWEIKMYAKDGGLLVAHGCKLMLIKKSYKVPQWVLSGYTEDGSDVDAVFAHVNKQICKVCSFYLSH